MSETPRLIKQIAVGWSDGSSDVFALTDDGSLWMTYRHRGKWEPWRQVPSIPHDDPPPPDGASP